MLLYIGVAAPSARPTPVPASNKDLNMGRRKDQPDKAPPKSPPDDRKSPPRKQNDDEYGDAGDIATPEPDRDDEQRGL